MSFPISSKEFYRAWSKCLFSFPELVRRDKRRRTLVQRGAQVHETAELGEVNVGGHKSNLAIGAFTLLGKDNIALHCPVTISSRVCINDEVHLLSASRDVSDSQWNGCNSKLRAAFFISHRYRPLCIAEGIRHRSNFLIGEGSHSFELHPMELSQVKHHN